ncbi:MAG: response regulator [Lachnobacterium sp.]|nr:response regulator [Lachnobacterium sp.]
MYKVMIVDDEPIIVEGLSRSIAWDKWNCKVVATAHDGLEGKKSIEEYRPDIIFMDINMPEMDGLSMIAAIKSQFPNLQICVLTGFRDFEYAREAIRLGVTRFLLKPSNMDELEEAISAMCANLKKKAITGEEETASSENSEGQAAADEDKKESASSSFIVKNALTYIEENYKQKLTLGEVAEKTYVSQWHLSKLLNRHTGQSFSDILNHTRIEHAKELLKDPSLRIGDISEQVGFLDLAHFSRVFKKQEGVSANEYRNQILGK